MHDESLYAERVLRAGGRGYIMKQEGGKMLMRAIRQVLSGQIYVSEKMAAKILEIFSGHRAEWRIRPWSAFRTASSKSSNSWGRGRDPRDCRAASFERQDRGSAPR